MIKRQTKNLVKSLKNQKIPKTSRNLKNKILKMRRKKKKMILPLLLPQKQHHLLKNLKPTPKLPKTTSLTLNPIRSLTAENLVLTTLLLKNEVLSLLELVPDLPIKPLAVTSEVQEPAPIKLKNQEKSK